MFMKSRVRHSATIKFIQLLLGTLFLALPPIIVWLSIERSRTQIFEENISTIEKKLFRKIQSLEQAVNPVFEIYHDLGMFLHKVHGRGNQITRLKIKNQIFEKINPFLATVHRRYGFNTEVSGIIEQNNGLKKIRYVNDQSAPTRLDNITDYMFQLNTLNKKLSVSQKAELVKKLKIEMQTRLPGFFDLRQIEKDGFRIKNFVYRQKNRVYLLINVRYQSFYMLNLLFDFSGLSQKHIARMKSRNWKDDNIGLAFVADAGAKKRVFVSNRLRSKELELKRALNRLKQLPNKFATFRVEKELFVVSAQSPQKDFRLMLSAGLPEKEKETELQLLLSLLCLISVFLWQILAAKLIFDRTPKISISVFIITLFIIVSLLPLVSSIYLANEFVISNFKAEKNLAANQLQKELTGLDLKTMDKFRNTLNQVKTLTSIKDIENFAQADRKNGLKNLLIKTLEHLCIRKHEPLVAEIWVYDRQSRFECFEWNPEKRIFEQASQIDPLLTDVMKPRMNELLNTSNKNAKTQNNQLEIDELKLEIINDLFLNLFGQRTYFSLKENIGTLIEMVTFFDKNFFLSLPIKQNGKVEYIFTYMIDSQSLKRHFPTEDLSENPENLSFLLFGTGSFFKTVPEDLGYYEENHPAMLELAQKSQSTKYRLEDQQEKLPNAPIILAQPAHYSDYVMVAKKPTKNLSRLRAELKNQVVKATLAFFVFMLLVSILTSRYFLIPIRALTSATREIIAENFKVRLPENHPDEFAKMAATFNKMARSLEEGKLLSTFVSSSLNEELEDQNLSYKNPATRKNVTVVFSGIKGFKDFSKSNDAQTIFEAMQSHLEAAAEICAKFNGEIDKMIEDKVMLVFEDEPAKSSAERAIEAALNLKSAVKVTSNLNLAIGINSGEVVSGFMGSEKVRLSKTVVGDPVNLAARLAAIAEKEANGAIVVSGRTLSASDKNYSHQQLEQNKVKGKTQSVEIFLLKS
jgi:class 3 adenylate cyclase